MYLMTDVREDLGKLDWTLVYRRFEKLKVGFGGHAALTHDKFKYIQNAMGATQSTWASWTRPCSADAP